MQRDHPRVCGEKDQTKYQLTRGQGSPPRMRGKAVIAAGTRRAVRITPAYAGKSQPWRSYSQRRWDHPRVCGEKHTNISVRPIPPGSPPRMRGKGISFSVSCSSSGITPAYAGKSLFRILRSYHRWDHPRVCGEKTQRQSRRGKVQGSPPRMRGKDTLVL